MEFYAKKNLGKSQFKNLLLQILKNKITMYWTLELASYLSDAPWPATKRRIDRLLN